MFKTQIVCADLSAGDAIGATYGPRLKRPKISLKISYDSDLKMDALGRTNFEKGKEQADEYWQN